MEIEWVCFGKEGKVTESGKFALAKLEYRNTEKWWWWLLESVRVLVKIHFCNYPHLTTLLQITANTDTISGNPRICNGLGRLSGKKGQHLFIPPDQPTIARVSERAHIGSSPFAYYTIISARVKVYQPHQRLTFRHDTLVFSDYKAI